jgi:putative Holliday junction resolvase
VAQQTGPILAFDYGSKRIGVAIFTPGDRPLPLTTVDASANVWSQISHLMSQHSPNLLIVGWPRGLDGQHTQQTHLAEGFADELGSRYDKRVIMQDEVLSSEEAQKRIDPKLPVRKQREKIDAIAAQIILEDYLREAK